MRSIDIASANGNDASITLEISNDAGSTSVYALRASLGCAAGMLEVSLADYTAGASPSQCVEIGRGGLSGLCDSYLPEQCTGVFPYSTYQTLDGTYELQIHGLCSVRGDVYLTCQGSCSGTVQCSPFIQQTVIQGGTVNGNNSIVIINGGPTNATFEGTTLQIQTSNNFTIDTTSQQNITIDNSSLTVNAPQVTLNQYCAFGCNSWMTYGNTLLTDQTITNVYEPLLLGPSASVSLADDATLPYWVVSGPLITYTGLTAATFSLSVCIQAGAVTALDAEQSFALLVTMWNVTGNTILDPGTWAQTALLSNSSSTSYEVNSVCSGTVTQHLKPLSTIALYAKSTDPGLIPGADVFTLKRGALVTFGATPLGCSGCTFNIAINTTYNSTSLQAGRCINFTYPSPNITRIDNAGLCSINSSSSCLVYANTNGAVATSFEGMCGVVDTPTVSWSQPSTGIFAATANITLLLQAGHCMALSNPSPNITRIDSTGLCSITSATSCLTYNTINGSVTSTFEGMCGVVDTSTVTWTQPSPGVFAATASGVSSCASCDANGTLNVQKLCSSTQCQVKSDPPQSGPAPLPQLCFTCGGNSGGGGGGDSGGGPPIVPIVPIVPLLPPFFPPIVPLLVPIDGSSSGGGGDGGGHGDHGPSPIPISTPTPLGIIPANITGGTFIPVVNFSIAVPFCGNVTFGWEVIDNSTLPSIFYICEQTFNGSFAWMPYCPCSAALSNGTVYYYLTSLLMGQNTTLYGDNSTQWINQGFTYLDTLYVTHLLVNGTLDFCPANTSQPLHTNEIASCNGGQVRFPDGVIVDGNATFTGTTNLNVNVTVNSLTGGSSANWTNAGTTTLTGPTTITGATIIHNAVINGTLQECLQPMQVNHIISCNGDAVHVDAGMIVDAGGIVVAAGGVTANAVTVSGVAFAGTATQSGSFTDATGSGPAPFPFGVWLTGGTSTNYATLVMASASATTFNAGSFLDIASGVTMRRQPVAATATTLTVTCNGKLCLITLVSGLCNSSWSTGGVCTLTVNNAAITIATTAARVDFTQLSNGVIPGTQPPPVLGLVNLLSGSVQVVLYCYGLTGCTAATQVLLLEILN